jgi:hypothetical protein
MITLELGTLTPRTFTAPRAAGEFIRDHIRDHGFAEFIITFPTGFEIEWTDPDLYLELADLRYFLTGPVPRTFVRAVFINWHDYSAACRHYNITP